MKQTPILMSVINITVIMAMVIFSGITLALFYHLPTDIVDLSFWALAFALAVIILIAWRSEKISNKLLGILWPVLILIGLAGLIYVTDSIVSLWQSKLFPRVAPYFYYVLSHVIYVIVCGIAIKAILIMRTRGGK